VEEKAGDRDPYRQDRNYRRMVGDPMMGDAKTLGYLGGYSITDLALLLSETREKIRKGKGAVSAARFRFLLLDFQASFPQRYKWLCDNGGPQFWRKDIYKGTDAEGRLTLQFVNKTALTV